MDAFLDADPGEEHNLWENPDAQEKNPSCSTGSWSGASRLACSRPTGPPNSGELTAPFR